MTKEIVVKYGDDIYTRNALTGRNLIMLGLRLQPKIAGLTASIGSLVSNQYVENENPHSYYKCIEDIFDAEDWKWFFDTIIYDFKNPIKVGDKYLVDEFEVDEHFAGDFIRFYTVTLQFMYKNLGEWNTLTKNMNGLAQNISNFLETVVKDKLTQMEQSFHTFVEQEKQEKKTGKRQRKV